MARVTICSVCDAANPIGEVFCVKCGTSLTGAFETDDGPPEASERAPPPLAGTFRETPASAAQLIFAWGAETVGNRLSIGRDSTFSPLADRLAAYESVSRRHAEVFVDGSVLAVRHLGLTNPTYVDGRPLDVNEVAALHDGAEVGFSRAVVATVRLA